MIHSITARNFFGAFLVDNIGGDKLGDDTDSILGEFFEVGGNGGWEFTFEDDSF